MPAVTVENTLVLPEVALPTAPLVVRPVTSITTAPSGFEGEGFPVRRAFAGVAPSELDPFVHMDQMGEVEYAPGEPKGTPWHPHRGFETVTYMIDGTFQHQDSIGGGGLITNGATQWMTAGAGILHIERPPDELVASGGLRSPDGGAIIRVIAGDVGGHHGPGSTYTPIALVHATLSPGAQLVLPWPKDFNALIYGLAGRGRVGPEEAPFSVGQLAVHGAGDALTISADEAQDSHTPNLDVLILGGKPIGEPVVAYGPFVMNTKSEIAQAFEDFEAGRLGSIPADHIGN
jgi:redox-sensitive bicupin YhaK (pirin superfamily)